MCLGPVGKGEGLKRLGNLIRLNGFRILVRSFKKLQKHEKHDSNSEKWLIFLRKIAKIA